MIIAAFLSAAAATTKPSYLVHRGIAATEFWVGEPPVAQRHDPGNVSSAWDESWQTHFGGFDDPKNRQGWNPKGFTPKENPFYCALPYNDFANGQRKADAAKLIPWAASRQWKENESMCKNRWIRITAGQKSCYAQWEDVGPFSTDDAGYVFGTAAPKNTKNEAAGLDLSPAAYDFLGLGQMNKVDWQFVEAADVPDGPWRKIITTSPVRR